MASGWVVMGDVQFLPGYCLLLPDPVVSGLNDLQGEARLKYLSDMATIGDAVMAVTGAYRINYEILGNVEPELHAHVFPRFTSEPDERRRAAVWYYDWEAAPKFSLHEHGELMGKIRRAIEEIVR
jgi:diadenosine tetraphosphate (Ap4A) HIT family hydrolase